MVNVRKRGNFYQYQFEVAPIDGKRKQVTKSGFKTKAEAEKAGIKAYNEYDQTGHSFKPSTISYSDYLDYWMKEHCHVNLKYHTIQAYENIIKNHIKPRVGYYRLSQITTATLQEFVNNTYLEYSFSKNFMKKLKEYKLDIVHIHSPATLGKIGISYAKKNGVPVVATMHSQYKKDIKRAVKSEKLASYINSKLMKSTFDKCDECWAVNSEVARIFYEEYGYKTMPKVMNNATEMLPVDNEQEAKKCIRGKYSIKDDEKVFLFVGRLNALKNIFLIVDALKILKKEYSNIKFKMLFVGNGQDEEELKKSIKNANMENEIILCGKVTDRELLAKYYATADLFLFPSLYDASSIVQIEAASQKTPGLFIEGAATTATIVDKKNGFLSKNDSKKYAESIARIMNDEEMYKNVSENCFKDLYKNWDNTIEEVYEKYEELITKEKLKKFTKMLYIKKSL